MDVQPQKKLQKLRTFAQDMERVRPKSEVVVPEENKVSNLQKAAAPSIPTVIAEPLPESKRIETPPVPEKHLPAFHELQKKSTPAAPLKSPSIVVKEGPKPATPAPKRTVSVRAKKSDLKTVKNVGGGTIITDSKADGFKLIPSIIRSIDGWIREIKKSFAKKNAPKYVITDTERRRGVIQKATSKTGSIFTADNETLKEEIRRRQAVASASKDVDINWSPNTEAGYALLESGAPKAVTSNVSVVFKKQTVPVVVTTPVPAPTPAVVTPPPQPIAQPVTPPPVVTPRVIVPPPVIIEPTVTPKILPEPAPEVPKPVVEVAPVVAEVEMEPEPEVIEEIPPTPEPEPTNYELTTPEEHYKIRSVGDIARINTNILSIGIIGAIAGLIIVIVLVRAIFILLAPGENKRTVEAPTPLIETTIATDFTVTTISTQAITAAAAEASGTGSATELRFVDETGLPISSNMILPALGFTSLPNLNRTISDIRLVVRGSERALVFTVTDSTTALGSLLSWEKTIVPDLANVLSIETSNVSGIFSDTTIGSTDVRIFTTGTGDTRLVYGFFGANTVIITTNTAFFTTLAGDQ